MRTDDTPASLRWQSRMACSVLVCWGLTACGSWSMRRARATSVDSAEMPFLCRSILSVNLLAASSAAWSCWATSWSALESWRIFYCCGLVLGFRVKAKHWFLACAGVQSAAHVYQHSVQCCAARRRCAESSSQRRTLQLTLPEFRTRTPCCASQPFHSASNVQWINGRGRARRLQDKRNSPHTGGGARS